MTQRHWTAIISRQEIVDALDAQFAKKGEKPSQENKPDCVESALGNAWTAEQYIGHDYPGLVDGFVFACHSLAYLAKNHCLVDGNKRLAWLAFTLTLEALGLTVDVSPEDGAVFVNEIIVKGLSAIDVVGWAAEKLAISDDRATVPTSPSASSPLVVTSDLLVKCVEDHDAGGTPFVTSDQVKQWFNDRRIDWGQPHGWRMRDAEDEEFTSPTPRLVKWKIGGKKIGYSGAWAGVLPPPGWQKIRP